MFKFIFLFVVFFDLYFVDAVRFRIKEAKLTENQRPKSLIRLKTELGDLIGYKKEVLNKTINIFYGVPYAEPPIGKLRFKKTKLIEKFSQDPYNALEFKPHCAHKRLTYNINDTYSEDCLYMNIFTPDLDQKCNEKYSVMVYINGGKSSIYQMSPFLDLNDEAHLIYSGDLFSALHNTILVTFNYRQDLFDIIYVENKLKGNLGLFDQNLVLLWVKKYIKNFCGNDENLTLFGNSYGARAVSLHLISKYSKNLIKNAILESGTIFFQDDFMIEKEGHMINSLLAIHDLGCTNYNDPQLNEHIDELDEKTKLKFFKFNRTYILDQKLFLSELNATYSKFESKLKIGNEKANYIDPKVLETTKFLSKYSIDLDCLQNLSTKQVINVNSRYVKTEFKVNLDSDFIDFEDYRDYKLFNKLNLNPNVNILIGNVENEICLDGLFFSNKYFTDQFNAPDLPKEDAKKYIKNLDYLSLIKDEFKQYLADYYTNETKWSLRNGYHESFTNFKGDKFFICPVYFFSKYASFTANSVQSYCITHKMTKHLSARDYLYDLTDYAWMTPCHGDELIYLFGLPWRVPNQFTELDQKFSLDLIELFVSFAKNGKMSNLSNGDKWPVLNKQNPTPRYVEINHKYLRERKFEFEERCEQFWGKILSFFKR